MEVVDVLGQALHRERHVGGVQQPLEPAVVTAPPVAGQGMESHVQAEPEEHVQLEHAPRPGRPSHHQSMDDEDERPVRAVVMAPEVEIAREVLPPGVEVARSPRGCAGYSGSGSGRGRAVPRGTAWSR